MDTSVGMHCGVIRALIDVDLAYTVTEPTPLGAHDLKLIINLLNTLKLPAKMVINQSDMGDKSLIEKTSDEEGVEISHKIKYSKKLVEAYSKGEMKDMNLL